MKQIDYNSFVFNASLNKSLDKILPVNPATGVRDDLVHKYEVSLTDSERAHLEQYLEVQQVSQPSKQLSDSDLISLCPSRYLSTMSDLRALAKQMRNVVADLDRSDAEVKQDANIVEDKFTPTSPAGDAPSK